MKFKKRNDSKKGFLQKGFIGPIGDDLPSLIPIVVALLLFFTIFSVTLNTYNSKNALIRKQTSIINVAREMRGESLLLDVSQFLDRCQTVTSRNFSYNFMIGVYPSNHDLDFVVDDFAESKVFSDGLEPSGNFLKQDDTSYFCGYIRPGSVQFGDSSNNQRKIAYSLRFYPVAVQIKASDYFVVIPGIMTMVVWE